MFDVAFLRVKATFRVAPAVVAWFGLNPDWMPHIDSNVGVMAFVQTMLYSL
jgi:hypothetical protein